MAKIAVTVPAGQFCADKTHLWCIYDEAQAGVHRCAIFQQELNKVEILDENGQRQRLLYKCQQCLSAQQYGARDKPIDAKKVLRHGWKV